MSGSKKFIEGKELTETIVLDKKDVKEGKIAILSYPYSLDEAEFNIIKNEDKGLNLWIKRLQLIGLGYLLTIFSKIGVFIYKFQTTETEEKKGELEIGVENWEFFSILIVILLLGITYAIKFFFKSDRDELVAKISRHFKTHK